MLTVEICLELVSGSNPPFLDFKRNEKFERQKGRREQRRREKKNEKKQKRETGKRGVGWVVERRRGG